MLQDGPKNYKNKIIPSFLITKHTKTPTQTHQKQKQDDSVLLSNEKYQTIHPNTPKKKQVNSVLLNYDEYQTAHPNTPERKQDNSVLLNYGR